jgi:uncharacterized membrane protein YkvA (DUF1232 family)
MVENDDYVEVEAEELNTEKLHNIDDDNIFTENKKYFEFYENLRRKFRKPFKGNYKKLSNFLFLLPDFFMLLIRLSVDKRVSVSTKGYIVATIAYVMLPIDLIPDFIPVIGYVDDLVLVVYSLNHILNNVNESILLDNWSGSEDLLELLKKITAISEKFLNKNILSKIKKWINIRK